MGFPFLPKLRPAGCGDPGAEINYSCLFSRAASQYLTRTPAAEGNRQKWAFSTWVRRGALDAVMGLFGVLGWGTYYGRLTSSVRFGADNRIYVQGATDAVGGSVATVQTADTALFRDPAAWMHLLLVFDTTQASGTTGVRISVNGKVLGTVVGAWAQNILGYINSTHAHYLGRSLGSQSSTNEVYYLDGYMAETAFFDGRVDLVPEDFGYTNRFGVWVPKKFAGKGGGAAIYGAQGWHLDFADALDLGHDVSGNGNHWTASGLTAASQVTDTPTHGFATLNPLQVVSAQTLSAGNLVNTIANSSGLVRQSTIPMTSGRWYAEVTCFGSGGGGAGNNYTIIQAGVQRTDKLGSSFFTSGVSYYSDSSKVVDGVTTAFGANWTAPSTTYVIGILLDLTAATVQFFLNGVAQGVVALPAAGLTWAFAGVWGSSTGSGTMNWNFGQRAWAYPANAGAAKALATPNLPCPPIKHPERYLAIRATTGGAGVADLPWDPTAIKTATLSKRRDGVSNWRLTVSTRPGKAVAPNVESNPELTEADGLTYTATGYTIGANAAYAGSRIDYSFRAAPAAGFDFVVVDHVASTPTTVPHAVGGIVDYAWVINLTTGTQRFSYLRAFGSDKFQQLNTDTATPSTLANWFGSSAVDLTLGASLSTGKYLVLAWRAVPGFSAFGTYQGNGAADGAFVPLDFAPALWTDRQSSGTAGDPVWFDRVRSADNPAATYLRSNLTAAEVTNTAYGLDLISNGAKARSTWALINGASTTYAFAAWADTPQKFGRAR